jgi:hypothetical protein
VNFATVVIETLCYGAFFVLTVTSVYLLISRHRNARSLTGIKPRALYTSPMLLAAMGLFGCVTAVCRISMFIVQWSFANDSIALVDHGCSLVSGICILRKRNTTDCLPYGFYTSNRSCENRISHGLSNYRRRNDRKVHLFRRQF